VKVNKINFKFLLILNKTCFILKDLWRGGTCEFQILNNNYKYKVRYNNMLKLFNAMTDSFDS